MDHSDLVARLDAAVSLRPSVRSGRQRLRMARDSVRKAEKDLDLVKKSLKPAVARLNELESGGAILAEFGPATLYEFWIDIPGYSGPVKGAIARLSQHGDIHQASDVKGATKGGLGGAVVGGVLFGPVGAIVGAVVRRKTTVNTEFHVVDSRTIELEIMGPGFAWSTVQPPDKAHALQRFRNLINARGSCGDIHTVVDEQHDTIEYNLNTLKNTKTEYQFSVDVAEREQASYDRIWNEYLALRLPLFLDIRTRWNHGSTLRRFFTVLIGPVTLVAWLTYFLIATLYANPSMKMAAIKFGGVHIAAILGIIAYYFSQVRLMK